MSSLSFWIFDPDKFCRSASGGIVEIGDWVGMIVGVSVIGGNGVAVGTRVGVREGGKVAVGEKIMAVLTTALGDGMVLAQATSKLKRLASALDKYQPLRT